MTAYYNEIDPYAAQWLRNLIAAGHIAPGVVDERSIEDVLPSDLRGFAQCHFFAGIGVWSYALRRAGWSDNRPVWTGSCPCQPFSAAGQGVGFDDQRHLWPHFHWLIQECRPASVLGEQVASKDADPWIDLVQTDLEALGFAFGAVAFPSASIGAPHIRDRTYWVAHAADKRLHGRWSSQAGDGRDAARVEPERLCAACIVANAQGAGSPHGRSRPVLAIASESGRNARALADNNQHGRGALPLAGLHDAQHHVEPCGGSGGLADAIGGRDFAGLAWPDQRGFSQGDGGDQGRAQPGPTNGPWRDADWLLCRDGKWRPVEPGTFPLVARPDSGVGRVRADWHTPAGKEGFGHRAGRLKGYGNAINAEAAIAFIQATGLIA